MKMTNCAPDATTVTFDVGGKIYRVSRSMVEQHPDSVLARLISDTWTTALSRDDGENTNNRALFIDRDGDRFAHVLDFMRYGKVTLPYDVPADQFLFDLDFFGILGATEETVRHGHVNCGHAGGVDTLLQARREMEASIATIDRKLAAMTLASRCFGQYIERKSPGIKSIRLPISGDDSTGTVDPESIMYDLRVKLSGKNGLDVALLNQCLEDYGLVLRGFAVNQGNSNTGYYDKVSLRGIVPRVVEKVDPVEMI
jgi:hypothetical protein